ncbi:hypothetical protein L1987_81203 [Smallanthus sonchifolius]|uniref:Uncharacterized protein n=1 Tax=Smallanthus sonchifolius TaxID=185202 RepID=A0ACB8YQX5_9ASTR|nr:hypothetical protein L1987_81203 [Smallanthus sonchifolius]
MASRASFSDDSRMIKLKNPLPKSMLLRDYLLDDMSSCSSNGFRSYPRRQCCTTVRFLVETDLNRNGKLPSNQHRRSIVERKTNRTANFKPKQSSMLQKASSVMIHVFKRLPFAGISTKTDYLPRSLSRKLLKLGFWKKSDHRNDVKRLTSFGDLLKQKEITPPPSPSRFSTAVTTATTPELTISTSNSNSDFIATTESFTTGNSNSDANSAQNDVADELKENNKTTNGKRVGTTTATATANATCSDSTGNAKKWQDKHEEQFSPVSVMDFPDDNDNDVDEEDGVSSMSPRKLHDVKGTKISTRKTRVSNRVHQLEPVKLEDRIAQSVLDFDQEESRVEKKAMALLQLMKSTRSSHHSLKYEVVETVLLGFFKENALEENVSDYEMLQRAKDWVDGEEQELSIDWESDNNRQIYIRDMEKGVKWSNYDHQVEKVNVGLEVECEIFSSLVIDVLIDFNLQ